MQYAMSRQALYADGKNIEILAAYEPAFRFMAEWWKQLYGESEGGKDGKGIFPASVDLTPDLHSMGQYIQDGVRMLQETVVFFDNSRTSVTVPSDEENLDGLNYLAGREMSYINEKAMQATKAAHISGGVPVTEIRLPEIGEEALGALIYFLSSPAACPAIWRASTPSTSPALRPIRRICSTCSASPAIKKPKTPEDFPSGVFSALERGFPCSFRIRLPGGCSGGTRRDTARCRGGRTMSRITSGCRRSCSSRRAWRP